MASLVRRITDNYRDLMDNKSDPRVNNWPLMDGPLKTFLICIFYAYFVKVLGPKIMENRKPFGLRKIMIVYNLFQVLFSLWLFYEVNNIIYTAFNYLKILIILLFNNRALLLVGGMIIHLDVNQLIIQTVQKQREWLMAVGGIL